MSHLSLKRLPAAPRFEGEADVHAGDHGGWERIEPITHSVFDTGYERTELEQSFHHEPPEE